MTIASIQASTAGIVAFAVGLLVIVAGIPAGFVLFMGLCLSLIVAAVVFFESVQENRAELRRTGSVTFSKNLFPRGLFSSTSYNRARSSSDMLSSGYRRSEYHDYGATDEDIEFWGLDQPGAPPPEAAGWVIMDMDDSF